MAFCTECGAEIANGAKFCAVCGQAQTTQPAQTAQPAQPTPPAPGAPPVSGNQTNTPLGDINFSLNAPVVGTADPRDVADNKAMAILSYILFFVPLIAGTHKTSPYVRFHVNQGTVLFVAALIYGVALAIVTSVVFWTIPWSLYIAVNAVLTLLRLAPLALVIIGIVNAANGKLQQLPIIGGLSIIK